MPQIETVSQIELVLKLAVKQSVTIQKSLITNCQLKSIFPYLSVKDFTLLPRQNLVLRAVTASNLPR